MSVCLSSGKHSHWCFINCHQTQSWSGDFWSGLGKDSVLEPKIPVLDAANKPCCRYPDYASKISGVGTKTLLVCLSVSLFVCLQTDKLDDIWVTVCHPDNCTSCRSVCGKTAAESFLFFFKRHWFIFLQLLLKKFFLFVCFFFYSYLFYCYFHCSMRHQQRLVPRTVHYLLLLRFWLWLSGHVHSAPITSWMSLQDNSAPVN